LQSIDFMNLDGHLRTYLKSELSYSYRTSAFHHMEGAIVSATFALTPSTEARNKQIEIITYRKNTQPYGDKSAGCVFQNPSIGSAGAIIDKCQLKGLKVGGAKVSEMHANYIINEADATSAQVLELMDTIKSRVKEQTGVELQSEIRYIPYYLGFGHFLNEDAEKNNELRWIDRS
jgi:UDP-N-acetylmuramate dehydrogenase